MAHNCYKKAFKGTKFFPQRPHRQGIKFLKFVRVDGKTPGKTMVCKQLQGIPPAGTCRERSRLVGTFGRQTPATRVRDGRKVVCEIAESRARMRGKLSSHPGGTTVPPGWNTCTTRVEHLSHPGGTPVPPWWDDNFMRAKQEPYARKVPVCCLYGHFTCYVPHRLHATTCTTPRCPSGRQRGVVSALRPLALFVSFAFPMLRSPSPGRGAGGWLFPPRGCAACSRPAGSGNAARRRASACG